MSMSSFTSNVNQRSGLTVCQWLLYLYPYLYPVHSELPLLLCTPHHVPSNISPCSLILHLSNMAPSRALIRCIASAQRRPTPHLLITTLSTRTQSCRPLSSRSSPLVGLRTATPRHIPIRRSYSQSQHTPPPEPPDYLSEGELHIFNKIKAELDPVRLEVCNLCVRP